MKDFIDKKQVEYDDFDSVINRHRLFANISYSVQLTWTIKTPNEET